MPFVALVIVLLVLLVWALRAKTVGEHPTGAVPSPPRTAPSPARAPSPAPTRTRFPRGPLLIHATGDVSLDPDYVSTFAANGYAYAFSGMGGLFTRDDLTIVNMECPVSRLGAPLPKEFTFECDPDALPAAKAAGVDVASMANNHSYDYGPDALVDTRRNLAAAGLHPVGGGRDPDEAMEAQLFDVNGWRVAVVGIDEVVDPYPEELAAPGHPGTACGHDVDCMVAAIERADRDADLVILEIHWGVELDTQPEAYQVQQAHRFAAAGADVIFGAHSHRLQPRTVVDGTPVFWSLGNFVWPAFSAAGSTTAIGEVRVRSDGTIRARLVPVRIVADGHPELVPG